MVKKVIGAVLVMMVLFSGSVWAKGSNGYDTYEIKTKMDTAVLFSWWSWSMAIQSGNTEGAWFA